VRLPGFKELRCPHAAAKSCTLIGTNLFLATSIGTTPEFSNVTDVPPDFTGTQLSVPHPVSGTLYLKLRDDPVTVQTLTLPVVIANPPATPPVPVQPAVMPAVPPQAASADALAPTPDGVPATAPATPATSAPAQSAPASSEPAKTEPAGKAS
jgi:hypothetical protein